MSRTRNIEFGNLICKFGDKDLMDFYDEVVRPAFFDESLKRSYGATEYFFKDVSLVNLGEIDGEDFVGISGTFVYDTILKRHQFFDRKDGVIVHDVKSLKSAPTSRFLLILNNHRLVYLGDVPNAPTMPQFRATIEKFLKKKTMAFINRLHAEALEVARSKGMKRANPSKADLVKTYPMPKVVLNPLTCSDEIGVFMDRFSVINDIQIFFTKTNSENDNSELFEEIQSVQKLVGSDKSVLKHHSSEGLNIEAAKSHVRTASEQGNQYVSMKGKNHAGNELKGNNEDFQLKVASDYVGDSAKSAAKSFFGTFKDLVKSGSISVPKTTTKVIDKIKKIKSVILDE